MRSIEEEALLLSPERRAALAESLLASLEPDSEIESAWLAEAVLRAKEIDQGLVELIPGEQVMTEALALCQ